MVESQGKRQQQDAGGANMKELTPLPKAGQAQEQWSGEAMLQKTRTLLDGLIYMNSLKEPPAVPEDLQPKRLLLRTTRKDSGGLPQTCRCDCNCWL